MASYKKKYKKSWRFENNILKKYIPLHRFNKAIDCIRIADSIAAVEAAALEAEQAAAAAADSLNADSTATETVAE